MKLKQTLLACCIAAASLTLPTTAALAAAPMVQTQAAGWYRVMVGDFEVTALSDGTVAMPMDKLLHNDPKATNKALAAHFQHAPVETSVNAYLVNTGSKLILIDTGAGSLFGPTLGKLAQNLKASGYTPEQVDEIYITHMHPDHIGGLSANGQRVFTNAVVRIEQGDVDYWMSAENLAKAPADSKGFFEGAQNMLKPYADAGKLKPFSGDDELAPGIRPVVTRGHTAGHSLYAIQSKGQQMVFIGDLIHVAAVQFDKPLVSIAFDTDTRNAVKQRTKAFNDLSRNGQIAAGSHLSFPGLGHIRRNKTSYEWFPLNYQSMPVAQ